MLPENYYHSVNQDLLRLIPPDAKTVLEIGCGEGALYEAYKRINPSVLWFGMDKNREALDDAPDGMQTWCTDLDYSFGGRDFMSESLERDIDCVIFGDVLEHLIEPESCLRVCTENVKPGAQVLACIPNVQHWTVIRDLLNGKWDYADSGLLDRTHLRFFTLKSIRKMFYTAGLQVFEIVGRDLFNEGAQEWYDFSFDHPRHSNNPMPPEMRAYQYVVRAFKPERWSDRYEGLEIAVTNPPYAVISPTDSAINRLTKLHIHAITAEACCARPRILEPFAMLGTIPGIKCTTSYPGDVSAFPRADVVIQQRWRQFGLKQQQRILNASRFDKEFPDKLIIAEVDDLPEAIGMDPMALKAVHAIQCSTEPLAKVCRVYNPNVMVFENQIAELPPFGELHDEGVITIFCGWQNRTEDWKPILPAINRITAETSRPIIHFVVIHDREFFDALETDNKQFFPFAEYHHYRELLSMCDIALLPLEDTPFNQCKSDIKFLECAAEGVAVIAGPLEHERLCNIDQVTCAPKDDRLKNSIYVFGYNNAASFNRVLRGAIDDAAYRHEVAENSYYYVKTYRLLSQHFRKRCRWYQSLLSSKPALDAQLLERVPELIGHPVTA